MSLLEKIKRFTVMFHYHSNKVHRFNRANCPLGSTLGISHLLRLFAIAPVKRKLPLGVHNVLHSAGGLAHQR
jgi:hypothetical protein